MSTYQVANRSIHTDDPGLSEALAGIYGTKVRPLCLCRTPGIEMYIARFEGRHLVKRMPNSGVDHAPACDSYEPPSELSGLGQVIGSAIQPGPEEGITLLKFDFSLSKGASRNAPAASANVGESAKTDGSRLSLRGTLHYLWEEAGFNRWAPAMAGKRSWYVIRKYLLQAAEDKMAKGVSLARTLYIPESFNAEQKAEIAQRRQAQLMQIAAAEKGARQLMLVIGEVKELAPARYGHKIVLKHLPDCHFMLNDDIYRRLIKRFEVELGLWDAMEGTHLLVIGTFGIGATGVASFEEAALMCVTENWIPFESAYDKQVLDAATQHGRRFLKGMRYNMPLTRPLACAVLSDTLPQPTAMYVIPPGASHDFARTVDSLIQESTLASWVWRAGEVPQPELPSR